jgi:uncharacterized OB-fold protein
MNERPFSDISYRKFLDEDRLMGSKCVKCGQLYVPPRHFCLECRGEDMDWYELEGQGELAAFTCIFVAPPHMVAMGYDRKNPYCTGVVTLKEGPRVVARIEGVDALNPDTIKIGTPLEVGFLHVGEGEELYSFLTFRPRA